MLAPLVIFVYKRIEHTKKLIESLEKDNLASQTDVFIYSDGYKNIEDKENVNEVRSYLRQLEKINIFKSITIIESDKNKGLASSIINGVNEVINKYKSVIVVEDDNITSPDFLTFMNDCLTFYQDNRKIWSIGAYSHTMIPSTYLEDVYFVQRTNSYAWATWLDRWKKVDWEIKDYNRFKYNVIKRIKFDSFGNDRSYMLYRQKIKEIDSWAIRFCYAEFVNKMYTVNPCVSKVANTGHDGSGTNVVPHKHDSFIIELPPQKPYKLTNKMVINKKIKKNFSKSYNTSKLRYIKRLIYSIIK